MTSVIILGLITIFLFKEGIEFFGQYRHELNQFRKSGMEYANVVTKQHDEQTILYRYLETILSEEVEYLDSLTDDSPEKITGIQKKDKFLQMIKSFQDSKEVLLSYEKKMVTWAAETKLFLITQNDLIDLKNEALGQKLPTEDFDLSIEEIKQRTFFTHKELYRWQNYFLRNEKEDLAKRINPQVGTESSTLTNGQISNLTSRIKNSFQNSYKEITKKQKEEFTSLFQGFEGDFLLKKSYQSFNKAKEALEDYQARVSSYEKRLENWDLSSHTLFTAQ